MQQRLQARWHLGKEISRYDRDHAKPQADGDNIGVIAVGIEVDPGQDS